MVDTSIFPYDCMVLIESPDPQKPGWFDQGSGVVIGPHTILTASHCIYNVSEQTSYQSFKLYLGWNAPDPKQGFGFLNTTARPHGWEIGTYGSDNLSSSDSSWDFAVIDTSYTFSSWLGVRTNDSGGFEHLTGYGAGAGGYLTDQIGTLSLDPTYSIYDYGTISSQEGDSGGPIWRDLTGLGDDYVTGVASSTSHACQLTAADFSYIESWVAQDGYTLNPAGMVKIWDMGTADNVVGETLLNPTPGPSWQAIGSGEFYRYDQASDVLLQNTATGQAAIWQVAGGAVIGGGAVTSNPGPSWKAVGTGDFNDDGLSDILWQNTNGAAAIWDMAGTGIIGGGAVTSNPGPSWKALSAAGDFNDDGHSDILWQNTSTGQVAIWEMNGTSIVGGGTVSANPGPGWKVIGAGDFGGRGYNGDILFQNSTSGQIAIWEMNGANIIGGGVVSADPGPSWRAVGAANVPVPYIPGDTIIPHSGILFQNTGGQVAIWDMNGNSVVGGGVLGSDPGPHWHAVGNSNGGILFQNG